MRRRKAREFTLQALFAYEVNPTSPETLIKKLRENFASDSTEDQADLNFIRVLIATATEKRESIDLLIEKHSENWKLSRMSRVDRNILRLATAELLACDDIASSVTIDEAVMLAKRFGTEESPAFINGIIDQVWKNLPENPKKTKSY